MKRLKYYKTNSQYKLDVMNLFFNWDPDKKNVYLVKEDDHSFYYKGHCDAEYEYTYTEELPPEEFSLMYDSGDPLYAKNYLVLTNYAQYFKSFKINGHELITEEGQEGPLYLYNIFEDSSLVTYNSPNIIQTLNPIEESYIYVSLDGIVTITFDRELTQEDSIVIYDIDYGLYIVLSYNPEFNSDYYSTEVDINDFITHETGTTVYKFGFNNQKRITSLTALAFIGVSNKHGLISSMADVIPTTIQYNDTTLTTTLKEVFIPEPLAYNNRNNDDKIKVTNNTKNIKVRFENPLTDNDSIIMYLFNNSALFPKNEELEPINNIVFPNVSTFVRSLLPTFSTYFTQIDENTYELNQNIIDLLHTIYLNIGQLDFNIFGVNKTEAPTSINDFIPCTIIIEEIKPLKNGTYYANFEYVNNINDFVNDYDGFFLNSDVTKFYKSGFKNLTTTGRYMFLSSRLEEVELSNKLVNIHDCTFYNVTNLKSINIPSNIKSIGYSNFYICPNLESVILNDGLKSIDSNSFYNCPKLNGLHIPKTVTYINVYALRNLPIHFKVSVAEGNPVYDSRNNCNGIIETANNGVRWGYQDTDLNAAGVGFLLRAYLNCNFEDGYEFIIPDFLHKNPNNSNEIELKSYAFYSAKGIETITYTGIYKNMTVSSNAFSYSSIKHFNAPNTITSFGSQACNGSQIETLNTIVSYCNTYSFECSNLKELNITDSFGATSCCFSNCNIEKLKVNRSTSLGCLGYGWYSHNPIRYIETNVDLCTNAEIYKGISKYGVIKCTDDYVLNNDLDKILGKGWSILDENDGLTFAFRILKDGLWITGNENVVTIGENTGYYYPDGLYKVYISGITEDTDLNQEVFLNGESIGFAYISDHDKIIFTGDNEALYTTLDFTNEDVYNEHIIDTGGTINNSTPTSFVYDPTYGLVYECNPANKLVNAYCDIKVNNLLNGNIIINRLGALYNLTIKTDNYICDFFDHSGNCCGGPYWNSNVSYATTSGIISISQYDIYSTTFKISIPSISGYAVPELPTIETHPVTITTKLKLIENGEQITSGVTINGVAGTYNSLEEYWEFTYLANTYTSAIMYNGAEVGTVDNLSEETQYVFIGTNNESYKEFNCSATINTTSGTTDYRIANSNKIKALLVDGVLVEPIDIVTISETDFADAEEITYVEGKILNTSGVETALEGYELSDYIPVNSSILVIWNNLDLNGSSRICEYNTNLAFVRQQAPSAANRTITLANTTKYIRIGIKSSVKSDVYVTDETNKKYLFRGSNVEFKKYNSEPGEHTITYAFDKLSSTRNLFNGCTSLKTVTFGNNFDTSEVTNMSNMFYGCTGLTSVNFDILDLSNVITLQGLFNGCSNLTEAGVSNWNISNVENLRETFKTCNKLNIDVSNWNTSKVTNMNSLFYDCHAITSLDLSNWDTSKVTDMGSMFWGLKVTSIDVSSFNTTNVTTMNNMFRYCSALVSLDLSNFDTSNVTNIVGLVGDCTKLTSLIMKGNIDKVTSANEMFRSITTEGVFEYNNEHDYSIALQVLPTTWNAYYPNLKVLNKIVLYIDGIETTTIGENDTFTINGNNLVYSSVEKCWIYEQNVSNWKSTIYYNDHEYSMFSNLETPQNFYVGKLPKHICNAKQTVVTTSESLSVKLFNNATKINVMMINGHRVLNPAITYVFDEIGEYEVEYQLNMSNVTNLNNKFLDCSNLTSIKLYFDTSNVTNMTSMFYNCTNLSDLDISSFNTSKVTSMAHMFRGLKKITSLDLSNFDTSNVTTMLEMFRDSSSLILLTMSNNVSKVTNVGNMFYGISTKGVLNYNCEYDYSKIINVLPSTWTPFCKNSEYTVNIKLMVDGNDVSTLNDSDVFTLDGVSGTYNSETLTWQFTHSPSYWLGTLNYNGTTIEVNNGKSNTLFMIVGGLSTYATYWSNANLNVKLINNITNVKCQIVDGVEVTPTLNYTFAKLGTHEVVTVFDNENITTFSELFSGCTGLRRFKFTNFNITNNITSMYRMFYGCTGAITLDLSIVDTLETTSLAEMFYNCQAVTTIDISNFDTSNVTNMERMFYNCYVIPQLDLSHFNTSKVTTMRSMFYGCRLLTEIDLSHFDTSNVTNMNYMFQNSVALTSVIFNSNVDKVTNMNGMFAGITTLGVLTYNNNYDFTKIINVKPSSWHTFCPNTEFTTNVILMIGNLEITSLNEGDSFTLDGVNGTYNSDTATWLFTLIPNELFGLLIYNEHVVTIPSNYNAVYYFFAGDMPAEMCNLTQTINTTSNNLNVKLINNSNGIKAIIIDGKQELAKTYHVFEHSGEHTVKYMLKDSYTSLDGIFSGCSNVTKFEFNNFNTSAVTNMNNMFNGCNSLKSIDLSMLDTSSVTTMLGMFNGCRACESFVLNGLFTTEKVTNMSSMFADCDKLNSSDLIPLNTSKVTNMNSMFSGCGVTSLDLSTFNTSLVTNMRNMFYNCTNLVNLNLTSFNTSNVTNMELLFYGCAMLESFNINKNTWITSKVTTMKNMFNRCAALTSIDVSGFDVLKVTTMHGMFSRCTNLQSLDLSNFVTTSLTNMEYTFNNCTSLEELDISNFNTSKVTTMLELFINSTNLKKVKMGGDISKLTNVNNMFANITTEGVLEYNCDYDYSKIIAKLPSTWTSSCLE